jgi:hypothetical protein
VEEIGADYLPLPDGGLLAAAVEKVKIREILAAVEANLGPVSAIDVAPAARVSSLLDSREASGTGLVLDVGEFSTCAAFFEKNALVQIRSFAFGGNTITRALAGDLSLPDAEAEKIKIAAAYGAKTDQTAAACRDLARTLSNTVEFLRLNEILKDAPDRIFLTGGGSLFKELGDELGKIFGVPVESLDAQLPGHPDMDKNLKSRCLPQAMGTALAAAARGTVSRRSFNFRQGEFALRSFSGNFRRQLRWGAAIAAVVLLLAAVDLVLDYSMKAGQAADLKNSISRIFKKHFPPSTVMVDPVSQLQKKLAEDRRVLGMEDSGSNLAALELLKELSETIPPSLDIVLTHLHYENNVVLLQGEAKIVDDVTRMKNELAKSKSFRNVAVGRTALAAEGARVNFDMRIELK